MSSSGNLVFSVAVGPGEVFVVAGAGAETAVEYADEAVAESSEGFVVRVTEFASVVVVGACSGTVVQRAERPLVDGVSESSVTDEAGESDAAIA